VVRSSKYLNNLIEQDHRGVKSRTRPMLGFKNFESATIAIAGVELLRRIHKDQFALNRLRLKGPAAPAIWNAVLSAQEPEPPSPPTVWPILAILHHSPSKGVTEAIIVE
jgi:hypothetical protein